MSKEELYTAGKLAKEWGVQPKAVKAAIEKTGLQPDVKKGACSYFTQNTAEKIKKNLEN
jgi:hypothetical protein